MDWSSVGSWIKDNAGKELALVGSLVTGNVPGAIAAGAAMISSATGTDNPDQALKELQGNPDALIKLKQIAADNEQKIREHIETMQAMQLEDAQAAQHEQQETIRSGDNATDEYVRRTRPAQSRQSFYATVGYVAIMSIAQLFGHGSGPDTNIMMVLISPAAAYMGFRAVDKWGAAKFAAGVGK